MQGRNPNRILRFISTAFASVLMLLAFASCERIYDYLDPCPHGVSLRFVYDYNMEFANAFPNKVDCLTLLVYDDNGRYVETHTVTGKELQDEFWRMNLDLPEGTWHFVAYGGLACGESSFALEEIPGNGSLVTDLSVRMKPECLEIGEKRKLHDFYWGELTLASGDLYSEGVVKMMKNTNNIRIVLQQMNGKPVNNKDFDFEITDDNTLFGYDNDLIPAGRVTYLPWAGGQAVAGAGDDGSDVVVAYSEFSTSRLMTKNSPNLVIRRRDDGKAIVDIPLNNYLLLLKSELYAQMEKQEFLDRESVWSMVFFLGEDMTWLRTQIKINDWTVRINDAEI